MKNKEIFLKRIEALRKSFLDDHKNLLVFNEKNIYYLTGFYGKDSSSNLLVTDEKVYLFVNFIYHEAASESVNHADTELIMDNRKNEALFGILKKEKIKEITLESGSITHADFLNIEKKLSEINIAIKTIDYPLKDMREIKDDTEIKIMRENCRLTEECIDFVKSINPGKLKEMTEAELAFRMEGFLIKKGTSSKSFDFIIANNKNSSKPHHVSGRHKIKNGIILMDFGAILQNYCSDITRTFLIEEIADSKNKKRFLEIYQIVKEAQLSALSACREGIAASELDKIARDFIAGQGYDANFDHSLGHGVGLSVHEPPFINRENNQILKESMVVTIEPGIYIPGFGGVRIEDMVIVKKNKCERLYGDSKELVIIG
ncbi:MAG TPA: aminopeptidase P family protein [Actinobacteria bacterium]|nr:aminopeptidase P family protein [Actinomycetota bacterium]